MEKFIQGISCSKSRKAEQIKYHRSVHKAKTELDVVNIVRCLQKLKAGVSALIKNDDKIMREVKELF